jgi:hypothetical protein
MSGIIEAHRLLSALGAPELTPFLDAWPAAAPLRPVTAARIPVLRYLAAARDAAPPFSAAFLDTFVNSAHTLEWRRTYTRAEVGAEFLDRYGWTELAGLAGPVPCDRVACGVLLLGPEVTYPAHRHEAEEIYVPLSGTAAWRHGGTDWQQRAPGTVIHHLPDESHAMRTAAAPLLALYLWRSHDLAQKSRLDGAVGA